MASKSHDLTHGPLVQQIILFSLPLMATNVLQVLFNMSDVAVVGQFAGPEALGSVGSTSILVSLFTGFLIGMGSGINVVVARYIGARHDQDVHEAVHTSLILSLIVGVIIMALGFLFTPAMLSMLGTKPVLMAGAVSYLRASTASVCPLWRCSTSATRCFPPPATRKNRSTSSRWRASSTSC